MSDVDKTGDWSPLKVRAELVARNISLRSISRGAKLNDAAASVALRRPFPRAEAAIAKVLGLEPFQIWPSRYPGVVSAIAAVASSALGASLDAGGRRLKVACPTCGGKATAIRVAETVPGVRDITYRCANPVCGESFVMQLSYVRSVRPRKAGRK